MNGMRVEALEKINGYPGSADLSLRELSELGAIDGYWQKYQTGCEALKKRFVNPECK